MTGKGFMVIAFDSTHLAIKVERMLKGSIDVEMIPTPRSITASCGLSIKTDREEMENIKERLREMDVDRKLIRIYGMGCEKKSKPEEILWEK
ncbi:MAG TPA: DUF3343 domain-containing protein [Clostridia bacterium]|nr:DUF3343 domain-containing protein [Clostridia bacterium]